MYDRFLDDCYIALDTAIVNPSKLFETINSIHKDIHKVYNGRTWYILKSVKNMNSGCKIKFHRGFFNFKVAWKDFSQLGYFSLV